MRRNQLDFSPPAIASCVDRDGRGVAVSESTVRRLYIEEGSNRILSKAQGPYGNKMSSRRAAEATHATNLQCSTQPPARPLTDLALWSEHAL